MKSQGRSVSTEQPTNEKLTCSARYEIRHKESSLGKVVKYQDALLIKVAESHFKTGQIPQVAALMGSFSIILSIPEFGRGTLSTQIMTITSGLYLSPTTLNHGKTPKNILKFVTAGASKPNKTLGHSADCLALPLER